MNRAELVQKLELVGRALASHDLIPIFKCFVFDGETVYAYDDAVAIVAKCEMPGMFAVDGGTLLGLLKNTQSEEVNFSIAGQEVTIKGGRSVFKLPYQTKEQFLFERPTGGDLKLGVTSAFMEGLEACLRTSSKDTAQTALIGVLMNNQNMYSCDGDALTKFVVPELPDIGQYMMPNQFCESVLKISQALELEEFGQLYFSKEWVIAEVGEYEISGRLLENNNPLDHAQLIKDTLKGESPSYTPIPPGLDAALSRAGVVAHAESAKTVLTVEGGKLKLLTETHMGVVRDVLPFKHPEVEAHVAADLVQGCVNVCNEMAILGNCSCYKNGEQLFVLLSNRT